MSRWCPRCDAVRAAGKETCDQCGTILETVRDANAMPSTPAAPPKPEEEATVAAVEPAALEPPRARARVALAVATLVVAGIAYAGGRASAPGAPSAAPTTTTPAAPAGAQSPEPHERELGWEAGGDGAPEVTAVLVRRQPIDRGGEQIGTLLLAIEGLPTGTQVFGVRGLELVDRGGGAFASVSEEPIGGQLGSPVDQIPGQPGRYQVNLGPVPPLDGLRRIELHGLLVGREPQARFELPTGGAWPSKPPLRAVEPATGRQPLPGLYENEGPPVTVRVSSAFVGAGWAVAVLELEQGDRVRDRVPMVAELRGRDGALCSRASWLWLRSNDDNLPVAMVVECPAEQQPSLELTVSVGTRQVAAELTLKP